ncbi:MAG TPA: hypothetical protein VN493_14255 [Thermoanaerobaculia bacterium]|nr:hypothetical protein [Thermoanaerobaculia bacterium]
MQVYFSHSYRDVAINSYFLERFVQEEIPLQADQKTDVWCVAKLERYLGEMTGFVSIIPRRETENDPGGYSPYIGHELNLARRARVPRLLFVDEHVLKHHQLEFPEDAVPFRSEALDDDRSRHSEAILGFSQALETAYRPPRGALRKGAAVVTGDGSNLRSAAEDVAEILRREGYSVTPLAGRRPGRGLDDIRLLETLRRAEVCVFLLGNRISDAHLALAMAHADCIPSIRLQYDDRATDTSPSLSGLIRWHEREDMLVEFARQLVSYEKGLVRPVDIAQATNPTDAARSVARMQWSSRDENDWPVQDGPALVRHVHPDYTVVRDEVDRVRAQLNKALGHIDGREGSMEVCGLLYDGIRRHRFGYESEERTGNVSVQRIRSPKQIVAHKTATCIDVACLFASLLEASGQNPLIVVVEGPGFAHALAGYRVRGEPTWDNRGIGDLRGALARRDAVLFEATGAVEADEPVGAEIAGERRGKLLDFLDAIAAATRMLARPDVNLKHFIDVRTLREYS